MERWCGKIAMVTGASSGIGAAIAKELVKHGVIVVGVARRLQRMQDLADSLSGEKGKLHVIQADVTKDEDVIRVIAWVKEKLGKLHLLINSAGIGAYGLLDNLREEDYKRARKIFETNVVGLIVCTSEALKLMKVTGVTDGHIVHVNSAAGHMILPITGYYVYNASKYAVTVLTEGLRRELVECKSKIRVTSISPGAVRTEFVQETGSPDAEKFLESIPFLESEDVANAVIYAISTPDTVQVHELTVMPVGATVDFSKE